MNDNESWYESWLTAGDWRTCWGCGLYAFYAPFVGIAFVAGYAWLHLLEYLFARYEWLYSIYSVLTWIPWGWMVLPALAIGLTTVPGIALCVLIYKRTALGKTLVGRFILGIVGISFVSLAVGIFFAR